MTNLLEQYGTLVRALRSKLTEEQLKAHELLFKESYESSKKFIQQDNLKATLFNAKKVLGFGRTSRANRKGVELELSMVYAIIQSLRPYLEYEEVIKWIESDLQNYLDEVSSLIE